MKLSPALVVATLLASLSACTGDTGPAGPSASPEASTASDGTPIGEVLGLTTAELMADHEYVATLQDVSGTVLGASGEPNEVGPDSPDWTIVAACSDSGILEQGQATLGAVPTALVAPGMRDRIEAGEYQEASGLC